MRTLLRTLLICVLASTAVALAQEKPPAPAAMSQDNPYSAWNKSAYGYIKIILLRSAEKVPEENYSFKPTDAVRTYGHLLGHVADAQYIFCSIALGEKNPAPGIEKNKASKGDLVASLKEAFAYCDKAYDGMTDASGTQIVKLMGSDSPKLSVLTANLMHSLEHYGNLVTYMRLKGIVPPTSEPGFMPQTKK